MAETAERPAAPDAPLSDRDREVLAFERQWWKYAGAKEQAIKELFDMSATRYYQLLNYLIDSPAALEADPMLVKRLRRLRAQRQRQRSARRLGVNVELAGVLGPVERVDRPAFLGQARLDSLDVRGRGHLVGHFGDAYPDVDLAGRNRAAAHQGPADPLDLLVGQPTPQQRHERHVVAFGDPGGVPLPNPRHQPVEHERHSSIMTPVPQGTNTPRAVQVCRRSLRSVVPRPHRG